MPRNVIGDPPFAVKTIDSDRPITLEDITLKMSNARGVSLCIRSEKGHEKRGGFFFHIEKNNSNYRILDFGKNEIIVLSPLKLIRFINHVSGRRYDEEMLFLCQNEINFRQDQKEID